MDCLDPKTDGSLYVDDFCMCYRSKSMRTIERHLQQCINRIENWASHNGFKFSKSKTQCVHFCQLRKVHNDPELYLYGSLIPVVEDFKFLGVLFDRKLSFIPHIKHLKAKCLKALNLLKVLSHTDWGADRTVLLQLYRSLIRSKLDYGSIVYGSARPSYISSLDTVHHQGLRLALGAFRTSPVQKGTSRQRSGKGAIRKRFPLQKPRWEKTKLTIRYLYHETYRKPNEQLFSQ